MSAAFLVFACKFSDVVAGLLAMILTEFTGLPQLFFVYFFNLCSSSSAFSESSLRFSGSSSHSSKNFVVLSNVSASSLRLGRDRFVSSFAFTESGAA